MILLLLQHQLPRRASAFAFETAADMLPGVGSCNFSCFRRPHIPQLHFNVTCWTSCCGVCCPECCLCRCSRSRGVPWAWRTRPRRCRAATSPRCQRFAGSRLGQGAPLQASRCLPNCICRSWQLGSSHKATRAPCSTSLSSFRLAFETQLLEDPAMVIITQTTFCPSALQHRKNL